MQRPRVIWAGLDCQPLTEIAAALDRALAPFGFDPERRAFHAHITLGRVNTMRNWPALEAALRAHWSDDFGECALAELIAYRSDLRRIRSCGRSHSEPRSVNSMHGRHCQFDGVPFIWPGSPLVSAAGAPRSQPRGRR
jgi:2'-5' RNA ligase